MGKVSYHAGKYPVALAQGSAALKLANDAQNPIMMTGALRLRGDVLTAKGHFAEAVQVYETAKRVAESFDLKWQRGSLLEALGVVQGRLGQTRLAERNLRLSLSLLVDIDRRGATGTARSLGELALQKGDAVTARRWYKESRELMQADPDGDLLQDMRAQEALLLCQEGYHTKALADLQACLAWWRRKGHDRWVARTLLQLATVYEATPNQPAARQVASEALACYERIADRAGTASARRHLSSLNSATQE